MNTFKRTLLPFLLAIVMALSLTACAKRGACEECGQTEKLNKYVESNGNVLWLCDDCYRLYKMWF